MVLAPLHRPPLLVVRGRDQVRVPMTTRAEKITTAG